MARDSIKIDYERGLNGEYIVLLDGRRYCTVDNWREYRQVKNELLSQDLLVLCQ